MEKKKLLYVAASVGLFLIIVIGAGYLAFSPGNKTPKTVESRAVPLRESPFYPSDGSSTNGDLAETAAPSAPRDVVDTVRNSTSFPGLYTNDQISSDGSRMVLRVPQPGSAVSNTAPAQPAPAAAPRAVSAAPAAPKSSAQPPAPAAPSTAAQTPASTARPASPPPAPVRTYDTWWIQTNSFTAKARAEAVKETLASRGISAIIENRDINGRPFFRVRVGPYTSQNEAAYWLNLVKAMEGFEDSQIWQNKSRL